MIKKNEQSSFFIQQPIQDSEPITPTLPIDR